MPARLAALCAEPSARDALRLNVEEAYALQRRLMRGELDAGNTKASRSNAPDAVAAHLEDTLRAVLKDMVCGYLDADVKRTADDLLRGEAEARPDPAPEERSDPIAAFGAKLRGRGRKRKAEPVLESWDEVVPAEPEPAPAPAIDSEPAETQEHEFVVRRTKRNVAEQETQETVTVGGVREVSTEEDVDWGFDDDPADYSAAV